MLIPDNLLQPVVGKKQVEPKESLAEELVELPFISLLMENSPAPLIKGEADNEEQATIPLKEIAPSLVSAKLLDSEPETKLPSAPLELKEVKRNTCGNRQTSYRPTKNRQRPASSTTSRNEYTERTYKKYHPRATTATRTHYAYKRLT